MSKTVHDLVVPNNDLASKIVVALEKISEVFRMMLWEEAKRSKLSPIQIQIIVFIQSHKPEYSTVSYLAKEFHLTKATISDSIKVLEKKEIVNKIISREDTRSYTLELTDLGNDICNNLKNYADIFLGPINDMDFKRQNELWNSLLEVISSLNSNGVITTQRMCYTCKYYSTDGESSYCNLLKQNLLESAIRIDCPEHIKKEPLKSGS